MSKQDEYEYSDEGSLSEVYDDALQDPLTITFPNLRLTGFLGRGAFGSVYRGVDDIQGDVAVKIFQRKSKDADDYWGHKCEELLSEGQRLKAAEHANVVRVHSIRESEGIVALVMEFCESGSVDTAHEKGPLPLQHVRSILNDVASGLQTIHARGMLHRDIKPSNIMLTSTGAKLGDFGLVTSDIIDGYAAMIGYIAHLAPEVFEHKITSTKTDIWAFGMTAYRLLNGKEFYKKAQKPSWFLVPEGIPDNYLWLPHVPLLWRKFVCKCLSIKTTKRYQSAEELLKALAILPVPEWQCDYMLDTVDWTCVRKKRRIEATWDKTTNQWSVKNLPLSAGRTVTLGEGVSANEPQALEQMRQIFAKLDT